MTNWLLLAFAILALEKAVPSSGRHRHGLMLECTKCSPGHSLSKRCNRRHDSECTPCPNGTYQPHHTYKRHCYLCSKCGDGLYIAHACTPLRDTVCDSCHTYKGPHNADYHQKCLREGDKAWTTPATLKEGLPWSSQNQRTKVLLLDDKKKGTNRRLTLTLLVCGLAIVTCLILFYLLSNRTCRKDRKTVKPGYRYEIVKEPVML